MISATHCAKRVANCYLAQHGKNIKGVKMAKKKDKPQVINNIGEINLEIDYDKLAESIVKAQEKSEKEANRKKKFTSGTFAMIISLAFRGVAILGWLIALATPFAIINMAKSFVWNEVNVVMGNVFSIAFAVALFIVLVLYSFLLWKSAKEIETEKDRNYITYSCKRKI